MIKRFFLILFVLTQITCGASTRHVMVVASESIEQVLEDIHATEQQALCGANSCANNTKVENVPGWTLAKSQSFNKAFLPVVEVGRQYNGLVAAYKPGTPVPSQINLLITSLGQSLTTIVNTFPTGNSKDKITQDIAVAQSAVLTAFNIVITVKGS